MMSRNKYAFCSEVWNLARLFSSKRDSAAESLSCFGRASVASGIPATPAAAAAVAPDWKNLRLENRSELIGPSCGARPIPPLRKTPGRRWVKKTGKLLCSEPALSTPMLIGRGFTLTHVSPPRTQSLNRMLPRKERPTLHKPQGWGDRRCAAWGCAVASLKTGHYNDPPLQIVGGELGEGVGGGFFESG